MRWGLGVLGFLMLLGPAIVQGADQANQTFEATLTDAEGLETDVTNLVFYWEEQLSETQLALHELTHVPAKRGAVPIKINFDRIGHIEFKPGRITDRLVLSITLKSGKAGEFTLERPGSFKGQTEFGDMIAAPTQLTKIVFK
ncbi:MAG: hypothetical protein V3S25_03115 [Nitrospirales bacterium]